MSHFQIQKVGWGKRKREERNGDRRTQDRPLEQRKTHGKSGKEIEPESLAEGDQQAGKEAMGRQTPGRERAGEGVEGTDLLVLLSPLTSFSNKRPILASSTSSLLRTTPRHPPTHTSVLSPPPLVMHLHGSYGPLRFLLKSVPDLTL